MKTRHKIEENDSELSLGLILCDQVLFSQFFQKADLSMEMTIPQKTMFCDNSRRILLCTSRNVGKTVGLIGRVLRDLVTYLPKTPDSQEEILVFTPAEAHLTPLIDRMFTMITKNPFFSSLVKNFNKGDKPKITLKTGLTMQARIEGSCLTGDTEIIDADSGIPFKMSLMARGLLPSSINVMNPDTFKIETTDKFEFVSNGIRKVFKVTLDDGSEIRATENHPFYSGKGWVRLDELSLRDMIAVPKIIRVSNDKKSLLTDDEAKMIGYMTGDGGTTRRGPRFTNMDAGIIDDYSRICNQYGCTLHVDRHGSYSPSGNYNKWKTNPLTDFLRRHEVWGKYSYEKVVPMYVYGSNDNEVASFVAGAWNCDGTAFVSPNNSSYLEYDSTSRELIDGMANLLLRLGMRFRILKKKPMSRWFKRSDGKKYWSDCRWSYRLINGDVANIRRFVELVKCDGDKQDRITKVFNNIEGRERAFHADVIPVSLVHSEIDRLWEKDYAKLSRAIGTGVKPGNKYNGYNRDKVRAINSVIKSKVLEGILNGDITFVAVKSIEPDGEEETYDLKVPYYHNFIANRIVVHNSGTDTNMVGIHPRLIFGDECEYSNMTNHRSRMGGAMPETRWLYAGVPNGVRGTPFYLLDQTKEGRSWSRHKFSMLTANPRFLTSKKYRHEMTDAFGGKNSPDYITQVRGEWGDEAMSSFPPGSISWNPELPYYIANVTGASVTEHLTNNSLPALLRIPQVQCMKACIGWDWGFSPDPGTFVLAVKYADDQPWKTYARVSMYQTQLPKQIDVLKYIWSFVLNHKGMMISIDSPECYQMLLSDENLYLFEGKVKLTNQGGTVDMDMVTGRMVTESMLSDPDVQQHKKDGKLLKVRRKYFLTEQWRRAMSNQMLNAEQEIRIELGADPELESELIATIERKNPSGYTTYEVPKSKNTKITQDQITDALRALMDSIIEIENQKTKDPFDYDGMVSALGWGGKAKAEDKFRAAWD